MKESYKSKSNYQKEFKKMMNFLQKKKKKYLKKDWNFKISKKS